MVIADALLPVAAVSTGRVSLPTYLVVVKIQIQGRSLLMKGRNFTFCLREVDRKRQVTQRAPRKQDYVLAALRAVPQTVEAGVL